MEKESKNLEVKIAYAKEGVEEVSGDAALWCKLSSVRKAIILSDGMGHGENAAKLSQLVVRRTCRNLKKGMGFAKAIKEVNKYLYNQVSHSEAFATVDVIKIDLQKKRACCYKMGASKTYIIRKGKAIEILGHNLPAGTMENAKITIKSLAVRAGDIVIMVSDGITEADRRDVGGSWIKSWLEELLCDEKNDVTGTGSRELAIKLLEKGKSYYGEKQRDDLTVIVAKFICGLR